jgi:hypothetical protein
LPSEWCTKLRALLEALSFKWGSRQAIDAEWTCIGLSDGPDGLSIRRHSRAETELIAHMKTMPGFDASTTSLQCNWNPELIKWHKDNNNSGQSTILAVRDFTRGEFEF